jgi:Copine
MNDYEESIQTIGNAVAAYSDQFCVWGFGAKFDGVTQYLFQCGTSDTVQGVKGILEAYNSVFQSDLIMSGPTVFDKVLQAAAVRAQKHKVRGNVVLTRVIYSSFYPSNAWESVCDTAFCWSSPTA